PFDEKPEGPVHRLADPDPPRDPDRLPGPQPAAHQEKGRLREVVPVESRIDPEGGGQPRGTIRKITPPPPALSHHLESELRFKSPDEYPLGIPRDARHHIAAPVHPVGE